MHVRKLILSFAVLSAALAIGIVPAGAVTDGELDGNGHPYVGLVTFYDDDGVYLWRCSATLMAARVLLTAGHCTEPPAASAQVWFDPGPMPAGSYPLTPIEDRPPCTGYTGWPCEGGAARGLPHGHPDYDPNAFFLHDLGVVSLDRDVSMGTYGALPQLNELDGLKTQRGQKDVTFTAVGYGLQAAFPPAASWKNEAARTRMVAHPKLNQINGGIVGDFAILLSNNASTGGTCFGDSGGPNFIGDSNTVAGVTSFGVNPTCAGTGGAYRVDKADDLDWLEEDFGITPP
jgi:hypothetical protein